MTFDIDRIRARFPALAETDEGRHRIYLDNPAGTQVPRSVADAMRDCLLHSNANVHGAFRTSALADQVVAGAHEAMADLLNAPSADEIVFGPNMTTLTLHLSRSIGRMLKRGDEIVLSRMDHDGNVAPWLLVARDLGLEVRWLPFNVETYEFDADAFDRVLTDRTRLVCVGAASNLLGTLNDVRTIIAKARQAGALTFIDGVQSVPHVATDVQDLGCDFLVCSAYKFFGPHMGILWGRREVLEALDPYKLRTAPDELPGRFETGTQNHEGMAGTTAAVNYFADLGASMASDYSEPYARFSGRRQHVHAALDMLFDYETRLATRLIEGLGELPGVTVHGITAPAAMQRRVPTVAITIDGMHPDQVARQLGAKNIFVWSGNLYALEATRHLGLEESGGVVRIGPVHYNTMAEIDRTLGALADILPRAAVA